VFEELNIIPNPGYELTNGCCNVNLGAPSSNCLQNWQILSPSPDYYSPDCLSSQEILDFENETGISLDNAIIRSAYSGNSGEVLGNCFTEPLEVDFSYIISFDFYLNDSYNHDPNVNFSLYGVRSCAELQDVVIDSDMNMPCADPNVTELHINNNFTDVPFSEWTEKSFSFVADYPYEAFFMSISCSEPTFASIAFLGYFDNYVIQKSQEPFALSSTEGTICEGDLLLSSPLIADYDFQWYDDGVAIDGATANEYTPTKTGIYQLLATSADDAVCFESIPIEIDESYEELLRYEEATICYGDTYTFKEILFSEPGVYNVSVAGETGCDTLYKFKLLAPVTLSDPNPRLVEIAVGESYPFGDRLLTEPGIYNDTLATDGICDSLVAILLLFSEQTSANLEYNSHTLVPDCSLFSLTVCNKGGVVYDGALLDVSFYDGDPVLSNSNYLQTLQFSVVDPLDQGDCNEMQIRGGDFSMLFGDVFAVINDDGTSATPFDLSSDFPNTNYDEVLFTDNLFKINFDQCIASTGVEICDNGIDDDGDGLVDCFDDDCCGNAACDGFYSDPCFDKDCEFDGSFNFEMERSIINQANDYLPSSRIVAGDVNQDGNVDLLVNDADGSLKLVDARSQVVLADIGNFITSFAIGDVILDNSSAEIIVVTEDSKISCYDSAGNQLWEQDSPLIDNPAYVGIADFDQDGRPEIYATHLILNGQTGAVICDDIGREDLGSLFELGTAMAVDIFDDEECSACQGLEYVAGPIIYAIDIANGSMEVITENTGVTIVGLSSAIDWDLDGDLEIVSKDDRGIHVWEKDGTVQNSVPTTGAWGLPNISNIDDDPEPELVYAGKNFLVAYDNDLSVKWQITSVDDSGYTGCTVFDFNDDGVSEVCYRDEQTFKIINGRTGETLRVEQCTSSTLSEYPIVLDTDNNDQADIITICGDSDLFRGKITKFSSTNGSPWADSRSVWNQINYYNVNVNEDLSIPIEQQKHHLVAGDPQLNSFLNQFKISKEITLDLEVDLTSVNYDCSMVQVSLCNIGQETFQDDLSISLYNGDPTNSVAVLVSTFVYAPLLTIVPQACQTISFDVSADDFPDGMVGAIINDAGSIIPPINLEEEFPNTNILECLYTNNIFSFDVRGCSGPNLTFDSYSLNSDCSIISVSICNTGSTPYTESDLFVSLYSDNPFDNTAVKHAFLRDNNFGVINVGACVNVEMNALDVNSIESTIYGMINDRDNVTTPFNLDIDFPTTSFVEDDYSDNLFVFNFDNCNLPPGTEICDNGIDDDGDGLIDAFDPACSCEEGGQTEQTFVNNSSFEVQDDCCGAFNIADSCIEGWEAVGGTADYYGTACTPPNQVSDIESIFSSTFDNSFVSFGTASNYSETIGACLIRPLEAGETYTVDLLASLPVSSLVILDGSIDFTVYGVSGACPDFSTLTSMANTNNICETTIPDIAEQLITVSTADMLNLEFRRFTNQFTPTQDIDYIIIAIRCDDNNRGTSFIQIAEVQISKLETVNWDYTESILVSGGCSNPIILSVPDADTLSYQWYHDSIPMVGETSSTLNIDPLLYDVMDDFHLYVSSENGCKLLGPVSYDQETVPNTVLDISICEGTIYNFENMTYTEEGKYDIALQNDEGCDSIVTLNIKVEAYTQVSQLVAVCEGESYDFYGRMLTEAGTYIDTVISLVACDTILTVDLNIIVESSSSESASICRGASYGFGGDMLTDAGIYYDTLTNQIGCDSIIVLDLAFNDILNTETSAVICEGQTYSFHSQILTSAGRYQESLQSSDGCDSIVIVELMVLDKLRSDIAATICQGDTYPFKNQMLDVAGTYIDTLNSINGCDSIVTLVLDVQDVAMSFISGSICFGDTYDFFGLPLSADGIYTNTLISAAGCDSIVELDLQVSDYIISARGASICPGGSYAFYDNTYTQPGSYIDTISGVNTCDSIITLQLSLNNTTANMLQDSICSGELYDFAGQALTKSGTYFDTLSNSLGCDSIITLVLSEQVLPEQFVAVNICAGEAYVMGLDTFDMTGQYVIPIASVLGCDTMLNLDLTVVEVLVGDTTFVTIEEGEEHIFNGTTFNAAGVYEVDLTSLTGCDSVAILSLNYLGGIYVPNIFATSSISGNDRFIVKSSENFIIEEFRVYDRWGNLVFNSQNFSINDGPENFWDGMVNGEKADIGVYVYYIEYLDSIGNLKPIYGNVTLL